MPGHWITVPVVDDGDLWGTGLSAWKWAEVFGFLAILGAIRLEPRLVAGHSARLAVGLVALALFVHMVVWMLPEVRRRYW
jgi:hypothetical protein